MACAEAEAFGLEPFVRGDGQDHKGGFRLVSGGPGHGRALGAGEIKFTGQVLPEGKKVTYRINLKRVIMRKLVMGIADATMEIDGREIYTANDLKVGLFTQTNAF